ncbi:MAG: hypothetical protein ABI823_06555 [Bryobacteraceae bacterium]
MEFRCIDLPDAGVILISPADPRFAELVAEIRHRVQDFHAPAPSEAEAEVDWSDPAGAVLVNRSERPIAAQSLVWKFEDDRGHTFRHTYTHGASGVPSLLLPFWANDHQREHAQYWTTILPGSNRFLSRGRVLGNNSDVRPPSPGEEWRGGFIGNGGGGGGRGWPRPIAQATLVLDGVFFADGAFAGPNEARLWEQIVFAAETRQASSKLAAERL